MIKHSSDIKPPIKKFSFTRVTFRPDIQRFNIEKLSDDIIGLFSKRVIDLAGTTNKNVKVYLNGKELKFKDFKQYSML
jgi:DNA topoisomerase-2